MDRESTIELMRLLHGELDDSTAQRLRERLVANSELQESYRAMEWQWQELQLPEPAAAPMGFATRVVARAKERSQISWTPVWWSRTLIGKIASAAVLAGGVAAGAMLVPLNGVEDWSDYTTTEPSMAESYLVAMQDSETDRWLENER
jgi:anti-sigma factor RsiW